MSRSSDLRSTMFHELLREAGDVVVGKFSPEGKELVPSRPTLAPEEVAEKQAMYAESQSRDHGAELIPIIKMKKGKPIRVPVRKKGKGEMEPLTPAVTAREVAQEQPRPMGAAPRSYVDSIVAKRKEVWLHNGMGKIKMKIEDILENERAYCLVFANEEELTFIPNPGDKLNFTNADGDTELVYFADTVFDWTDKVKKLMILFKTSTEE